MSTKQQEPKENVSLSHAGKQLGDKKDWIMAYTEIELDQENIVLNEQAGPRVLYVVCLHLHDLFRTEDP